MLLPSLDKNDCGTKFFFSLFYSPSPPSLASNDAKMIFFFKLFFNFFLGMLHLNLGRNDC